MASETYKGLSANQAKDKLRTEGSNSLPSSKPKNFISIALGVAKEPMFILLVGCGTLYIVLGNMREGFILLGFVFVIMGIEFFQEKKTEKALDALKDMASPRALVIRDGEETRIPGFEVVTDDIIVLQEGDRVPADATVLHSVNLLADESLLTGEPVPVRKSDWDGVKNISQPGGGDLAFVYSGTMKTSSITKSIKEFLVETMFSSKKAKDDLIKEKKDKSASNRPKVTKRHFHIPEDKKFRNVTE